MSKDRRSLPTLRAYALGGRRGLRFVLVCTLLASGAALGGSQVMAQHSPPQAPTEPELGSGSRLGTGTKPGLGAGTGSGLERDLGKDGEHDPGQSREESTPGQVPEEGAASGDADSDTSLEDAQGIAFLHSKFAQAQKHFDDAQYYAAYRIADSILVLSPQVSFRRQAIELRRRAQAYYLGSKVIVVTFVPDAKDAAVFPREVLRGELHIENIGAEVLQLGRSGEPGILGQAVFSVTDLFADGGEASANASRTIRYDSGCVLEVGDSVRFPLELELPRAMGSAVGQVIKLDGFLRSSLLRKDGQEIVRQVPWQHYRHVPLREELAGVDDAPFEHLQLALLTGDAPRFVTAARLWRHYLDADRELTLPRREHTLDLLLADLIKRDDNPLEGHLLLALEQLTDEDRRRTRQSWLIYAAERERDKERVARDRKRP